MSEIALRFLLANLAAACAIVLVIALRKSARAAFGARLAYSLWLLVPLAALGSLLPPRIVEIARPAPAMTASYPPPSFAPDSFPAPPVFTPAESPAPPATPSANAWTPDPWTLDPWTLDPWSLGVIVWLAGALAMAIWQLRGQQRFLADARAGFAGPAVAGVFKPRIITPADFEDRFEKSERDVILAHEKIHLDNNDARINALVALLRCLCWFNPLVHIAAHLMRVDQELACDATVVERHPRARAVYATALLKAQLASRPLPLGCYWPAGTEHPLTERVEMLKQARPTRLRRHIGIAALALLTIGACATAWAALPPETRIIEAPQDQPAPTPPKPVDFSALPGFDARDQLEITGEVVRRVSNEPGSDFWLQATEIRRNGGPAEPNTQLWRVDLSALRAGGERIMAGEDLGYAPPKNPPPPELAPKYVRVSAYGASGATCNPECRALAVLIKLTPKPDQRAASDAPQDQSPSSPRETAASPFDNVHVVVLKGRITRIELGKSDSHIWVETSSATRPDRPAKQARQLWLVLAAAELNAPNWARDPKTIGMAVEVRGYSGEEGACNPNCTMNGTAIRQLSGYPMPGITFGSGFWLPPGPPLPDLPKTALQPIRYEPQQTQQSIPADSFNVDAPIYLRGTVEKIDFADTTYVIHLRASSIGRDTSSSPLPILWGEDINTALWEVSPTNYFGARDSIEKDLLGRAVIARGDTSSGLSCASGCRLRVRELVVPKSTAVPAPGGRPFGVSDFAMYYDTTQPMLMSGKVQRLEFADRTFDVWMQTKGYGVDPGVLYQVRSEYFLPRVDIEARLLNQEIVASGWPARGDYHGFCSPVCGMYAEMIWLADGTQLRPGSTRPISPPPLPSTSGPPAPTSPALQPALYELQQTGAGPELRLDVTADNMSFDPMNEIVTYAGNVEVRLGGDRALTADRMTIQQVQRLSSAPRPMWTLRADTILENKQADTITLEGNAEARFGDMIFKGEKLTMSDANTRWLIMNQQPAPAPT